MNANLPASIETATRAVSSLGSDVLEVADCLAMAFGLNFARSPVSDERYGSLSDAIETTAGNLDALAKTAEAASLKLRGATQPVRELPRPEARQELPCPCEPNSETLTTPPEAISDDDGDYDPVSITPTQEATDGPHEKTDLGSMEVTEQQEPTEEHQPIEPGESVIYRPVTPPTGSIEEAPRTHKRGRKPGKGKR